MQFNTREHVLGPFLVLVELAQRQRDPVEAEREHPRLLGAFVYHALHSADAVPCFARFQ